MVYQMCNHKFTGFRLVKLSNDFQANFPRYTESNMSAEGLEESQK